MISVRSMGSVWLIDEDRKCYLRMPKQEMEREPGWWREPEPGDMLYDLEWHPYLEWYLSDSPVPVVNEYGQIAMHDEDACPLLVIRDGNGKRLLAPNAELM